MEPIINEQIFKSRIEEFDKKETANQDDIQGIKQLIFDNPDFLLDLDKATLSRLEVKLIDGGIPNVDSSLIKIQQIVSAWRNDITGLINEISKALDLFQKLASITKDDKLVNYYNRRTGENELYVEKPKALSFTPWKIASSIGTLALYSRSEAIADVMKVVQSIQSNIDKNIHKLIKELSEKNISNPDFEEGFTLLNSIVSVMPHAIESLDHLKTDESRAMIEEEQQFLIEVSQLLTPEILNEIFISKDGIPLILKKDIVCEFSQGRLTDVRNAIGIKNEDDDNQGSLACAVICMKAVQAFFNKGLPKNELEIYQLIDQGVAKYKKDEYNGLVLFEDVLNNLDAEDQNKIETANLTMDDGISQDVEMAFKFVGEFTGSVNLYLDALLEGLQKKVNSSQSPTCAVLTTQTAKATNATIVVMFDENKKPVLFNSHGEPYKGEDKGASLLLFNDMDEISRYIRNTFFKGEDGQFQLRILREFAQ